MTIMYAMLETPLGRVGIAATDKGVCFLQLGNNKDDFLWHLAKAYPEQLLFESPQNQKDKFPQWLEVLQAYLQGNSRTLDFPLDISGTRFQKKVWQQLQAIPVGQVATYSQIAQAIGKPTAARAVASACAKNNIAVAIPCHRVVRSNGQLSGYRWGVERKAALLALEANN